MPPKLCGNTAPLIISHRVAPSASAACLSARRHGGEDLTGDRGDDRNDHDGDDEAGGHERCGRCSPARRTPSRDRDPAEHVVEPVVDRHERRRDAPGCAHRPKTTDGTAASRSMTVTTMPRTRRGASSVRNSAMPIETGTAKSRRAARPPAVPKMNASAPNCGVCGPVGPSGSLGTQVELVKKLEPAPGTRARPACTVVNRISARIASTSRPATRLSSQKARSADDRPALPGRGSAPCGGRSSGLRHARLPT